MNRHPIDLADALEVDRQRVVVNRHPITTSRAAQNRARRAQPATLVAASRLGKRAQQRACFDPSFFFGEARIIKKALKIDPIESIIATLLQAGLVSDGQAAEHRVFVPTVPYPILRGDLRVTLGPRTVNVYITSDHNVTFLAQYHTRDIDLVELRTLVMEHDGQSMVT